MVTWLPIGPVGPGEPGWYVALRAMNCDYDALSGSSVQDAASSLCTAAVTDDSALWALGEQQLIASDVAGTCHDQAATAALSRLMEFHRQYPGSTPVLVDAPGTACPLEVTRLSTLPDGEFVFDLDVPACGGTPVYLSGNLLDAALPPGSVRSVTVGGTPVPIEWEGGPHFLAPPPPASNPVAVVLADADYPIAVASDVAPALFYAEGTGTCPGTAP